MVSVLVSQSNYHQFPSCSGQKIWESPLSFLFLSYSLSNPPAGSPDCTSTLTPSPFPSLPAHPQVSATTISNRTPAQPLPCPPASPSVAGTSTCGALPPSHSLRLLLHQSAERGGEGRVAVKKLRRSWGQSRGTPTAAGSLYRAACWGTLGGRSGCPPERHCSAAGAAPRRHP